MKFGEVSDLLKEGYPVYRESWNKGLYVVKQIDSDINSDIVPRMQSLPSKAKDLVLSHNDGSIHYRNQCLLINVNAPEGTVATNYIPDWNDQFSNDWKIYDRIH